MLIMSELCKYSFIVGICDLTYRPYIRVWLTYKLCECSAAKINTSKNRVHPQIKKSIQQ